ncbi:unnamed protein product [Xylocopa violacea]|uniref:C2H2-type domain-containing protein n=1 Tax=Xylocopa violacea TaxID=135666 RepID=A0ABP1NFW2_XYLVO
MKLADEQQDSRRKSRKRPSITLRSRAAKSKRADSSWLNDNDLTDREVEEIDESKSDNESPQLLLNLASAKRDNLLLPSTSSKKTENDDSNDFDCKDLDFLDCWEIEKTGEHHVCSYCKAPFARYPDLVKHTGTNCMKNPESVYNRKIDDRLHVCNDCGCRYKHRKNLTYHMRHQCKRYFHCPTCDEKLRVSSLEQHIKRCTRKFSKPKLKIEKLSNQ